MKQIFYPAHERGSNDIGWLKANFSFSFGPYYNPAKMHFGALRVLNDDMIAAGRGFGRQARAQVLRQHSAELERQRQADYERQQPHAGQDCRRGVDPANPVAAGGEERHLLTPEEAPPTPARRPARDRAHFFRSVRL